MSEINWGTFGATNDPRTYEAARQARNESRRLQQEQDLNNRKFAAAQAQQQVTQTAYAKAAELYAKGDYDGAKAAVLGVGNHELMNATNTSSTQSFEQHRQGLQVVGSYAKWIAENVPNVEDRKAMIAANRQMFINAGADEGDIDAVAADPSDAVLGGVAHMYYAPKDQDETKQKAYDGETARLTATNPVVVGGSLVTRGGEELYRSPEYINAPSGSNVYEVGGVSSNGYVQGNMSSDQVFGNMIQAESRGQQFASNGKPLTSSAGAVGIAQVMPGTAPEAARLAGLPWDANRYRNDPEYNRALGKAYFDSLVKRYQGDHEKAVAAYNAGPGRVDKAVSRNGANWRSDLPAETQGYVTKVLGRRDTTRPTRQIQQAVVKPTGSAAATAKQVAEQSKADEDGLASLRDARESLVRVRDTSGRSSYTGGLRWYGADYVPGTGAYDFKTRVTDLQSKLTMTQLGKMKGVLSDSDMKLLAAAAGRLDVNMSDAEFGSVLRIVDDKLAAAEKRIIARQRSRSPQGGGQQQAPQVQSKTVGGKTYYRVNGAWYDNPEGR